MDKIEMLERLISLKNNALERSRQEAKGNPLLQPEIQAYILEQGIEQLVMEIQNTLLAEYHTPGATAAYKIRVSTQAS